MGLQILYLTFEVFDLFGIAWRSRCRRVFRLLRLAIFQPINLRSQLGSLLFQVGHLLSELVNRFLTLIRQGLQLAHLVLQLQFLFRGLLRQFLLFLQIELEIRDLLFQLLVIAVGFANDLFQFKLLRFQFGMLECFGRLCSSRSWLLISLFRNLDVFVLVGLLVAVALFVCFLVFLLHYSLHVAYGAFHAKILPVYGLEEAI